MRTIPLLGLAFTLAACGHDSVAPTPTQSTVPGTYSLTTVDGQVLPFTVIDLGAYQAKLASGTLSLRADGSYSMQFGIRIEDSGNLRTAANSDDGLWNVNDSVTAQMMRRFYEGLFAKGLSPAAALRAAQVAMWQQRQWRSPYYWAAFVLQGEWR